MKTQSLKWYLCCLFISLVSFKANATVKLPAIFTDNMLMQQQAKASIWGMTVPGKKIAIATSWDGLPPSPYKKDEFPDSTLDQL